MRDLGRGLQRGRWNLELHQQHIARADGVRRGLDVGGRQQRVGAWRDDDCVLTTIGDGDERKAGALSRADDDALEFERLALARFGAEGIEKLDPMRIVPDGADERDVGTESGCRDGLVRTLATGEGAVGTTQDCLALAGDSWRADNKVHVE